MNGNNRIIIVEDDSVIRRELQIFLSGNGYELFKIPEKTAVAMSGYSKNGFHMKADNYEQTKNYKEELEIFDKEYNISTLIKRNRPVPENFDKLIHWYEKKGSLEMACIHCKLPMIFPVDYKRLLLNAEGGRKELARCTKLYDTDLINLKISIIN